MLLIISTFFGVCWLVQYRSFRQTEQTQTPAPTAKIITLLDIKKKEARKQTIKPRIRASRSEAVWSLNSDV